MNHCLSWQGLQLPLQDEWRPLRIEGDRRDGSVTIGDRLGPVFQLRWLRCPEGYDGEAWIESRRGKAAAGQSSPKPPRPAGFEVVSWIENLAVREESEKTVWWGFSKTAGVLVEILLTNLAKPATNKWFLKESLPSLVAYTPEEDWFWQVYSASFKIPAGFEMERHRLSTGDMVLSFKRNRWERLLVRQVYPAGLALGRRTLAGWSADVPFTRHRHFREAMHEEASEGQCLKRIGEKKIAFPLGWLLPIRCESLALQDTEFDRLLIAECEWRGEEAPVAVEDLIAGMNRSE